jgi:hypothetical protein
MAQTFTVGKDGFLTQIDLQILRYDTPTITHDLLFSLTAPTNSNFPIAAPALFSASLHPADVPNLDGFFRPQAVTSIDFRTFRDSCYARPGALAGPHFRRTVCGVWKWL